MTPRRWSHCIEFAHFYRTTNTHGSHERLRGVVVSLKLSPGFDEATFESRTPYTCVYSHVGFTCSSRDVSAAAVSRLMLFQLQLKFAV